MARDGGGLREGTKVEEQRNEVMTARANLTRGRETTHNSVASAILGSKNIEVEPLCRITIGENGDA